MGSGEYRRYAAECLRIAAKARGLKTKATLLAMVDAWLYLAELAEKNAKREEREQHWTRLNSSRALGSST
jgi:hypothetical protein